jgi:hypothetical protein
VFSPDVVFAFEKLRDLLAFTLGVSRLKGVFRTEHDEWFAFNRVHDSTDVRPTAYRRDSRVEVFAAPPDRGEFRAEPSLDAEEFDNRLRWEEFTVGLLKCFLARSAPRRG